METNELAPDVISAVMRRMAAHRKRVDTVCERCGKTIEGSTVRRRWCGEQCRWNAAKQRARDREKARQI